MDEGYHTAPEQETLHPKSQFGRQILTRAPGWRRSTLANQSEQRRFCPARKEFGLYGAADDGPANSEVKCRAFQTAPCPAPATTEGWPVATGRGRGHLSPDQVAVHSQCPTNRPLSGTRSGQRRARARSIRMNRNMPELLAQFSWFLGPGSWPWSNCWQAGSHGFP